MKRIQAEIPREADPQPHKLLVFWLSEMMLSLAFFSLRRLAYWARLQVKLCPIFCRIFQEQHWVRGGLFNF